MRVIGALLAVVLGASAATIVSIAASLGTFHRNALILAAIATGLVGSATVALYGGNF